MSPEAVKKKALTSAKTVNPLRPGGAEGGTISGGEAGGRAAGGDEEEEGSGSARAGGEGDPGMEGSGGASGGGRSRFIHTLRSVQESCDHSDDSNSDVSVISR